MQAGEHLTFQRQRDILEAAGFARTALFPARGQHDPSAAKIEQIATHRIKPDG
jgi:hypothetical protein